MNAFEVLWQYRDAFLGGFLVTVQLLAISSIVGTLFGIGLEVICQRFGGLFRPLCDAAAFSSSAIPALVILFWLHYPAQAIFNITVPPLLTAVAALSFINSFAVYRIVADATHEFPKQYVATGLVCGMTTQQIARYIQAPLLLRFILPRWIDQQVVLLHTSLFAAFISVEELFRVSLRVNSIVYQPVAIYTAMALIFLCTAGSAMYYAKHLRGKYYRDFSER
jgi:polar amino acid transport system permease protein